jgi:hypothetical protein
MANFFKKPSNILTKVETQWFICIFICSYYGQNVQILNKILLENLNFCESHNENYTMGQIHRIPGKFT